MQSNYIQFWNGMIVKMLTIAFVTIDCIILSGLFDYFVQIFL